MITDTWEELVKKYNDGGNSISCWSVDEPFKLRVGWWICVEADGCFIISNKKKDVIQSVRCTNLDYYKHPHCTRLANGFYELKISDSDDYRYFSIERITEQNIKDCQEVVNNYYEKD